jgi:hypothetical protein
MRKITPLNDKIIGPSIIVQELNDSVNEIEAVLVLAIDNQNRVTLSYSSMADSDITMLAACLQKHVYKRLDNA